MRYDLLIIGNDAVGLRLARELARQFAVTGLVEFPDSWIHTWLQELVHPFLSDTVATPAFPRQYNLPAYRQRWLTALERDGVRVFSSDGAVKFPGADEVLLVDSRQVLRAERLLIATGLENWTQATDRTRHGIVLVPEGREELERGIRLAHSGWPVQSVLPRRRWMDLENPQWLPLLGANEPSVTVCEEILGVRLEDQLELLVADSADPCRAIPAGFLYAPAWQPGGTESLQFDGIGLQADERGKLWCDDQLQTWTPGILAAGDVVGFPPLPLRQQWQLLREALSLDPQPWTVPFSR